MFEGDNNGVREDEITEDREMPDDSQEVADCRQDVAVRVKIERLKAFFGLLGELRSEEGRTSSGRNSRARAKRRLFRKSALERLNEAFEMDFDVDDHEERTLAFAARDIYVALKGLVNELPDPKRKEFKESLSFDALPFFLARGLHKFNVVWFYI